MMVWLLAGLVFASVVLLVLAAARPYSESAEGRLERFGFGAGSRRTRDLSLPFSERVVFPALEKMAQVAAGLAPASIREKVEQQLVIAGNPGGLRAPAFLTIFITLTICAEVLYLLSNMSSRGLALGVDGLLAMLVLAAVFGYLIPRLWLSMAISSRKAQIEKRLPDSLDLITISVEAGLTLEAALARVVSRSAGALADEFARALEETRLGKSRSAALRDVARRTGVADLQSVIAALIQAEDMGTSIAPVLRVQSEAVRIRRRQRAQEQAIQAPVKMLFPLIFFILPALFVVVLGPAVIRIARVFFQ